MADDMGSHAVSGRKARRVMKDEYLSIAEFAKQAGVTKQAVYKRLNKDLATYTTAVDGVKCVNSKALKLFGKQPVASDTSTTIIDLVDHLQKQHDTLSHLVDVLEADNAKLYSELDIKNKQLLESNERQRELSIMLDQQQKLNAHALLAGSQLDPEPVTAKDEKELQAEIDAAYQRGQADVREELRASLKEYYDRGYEKGKLETQVQYDLGYRKGKAEEQQKMAEIAKALYRRYPAAADYLLEMFSK